MVLNLPWMASWLSLYLPPNRGAGWRSYVSPVLEVKARICGPPAGAEQKSMSCDGTKAYSMPKQWYPVMCPVIAETELAQGGPSF